MGMDENVVVDLQFYVYGIENLCVVDVFVMLMLVGGNMNVFMIMIVEKVFDFIIGELLLLCEVVKVVEDMLVVVE